MLSHHYDQSPNSLLSQCPQLLNSTSTHLFVCPFNWRMLGLWFFLAQQILNQGCFMISWEFNCPMAQASFCSHLTPSDDGLFISGKIRCSNPFKYIPMAVHSHCCLLWVVNNWCQINSSVWGPLKIPKISIKACLKQHIWGIIWFQHKRIFMFADCWFKITCDLLCHHFFCSLSLDTNLTSRRNTGKPSQSASGASTSGAAAASKTFKQSANTNTSSAQAAASINGHMQGCNMYMMVTLLSRYRSLKNWLISPVIAMNDYVWKVFICLEAWSTISLLL